MPALAGEATRWRSRAHHARWRSKIKRFPLVISPSIATNNEPGETRRLSYATEEISTSGSAGSSSAPASTNRSFSCIPSQSSIGCPAERLNFPWRDVSNVTICSIGGASSPRGLLVARLSNLGRAAKPNCYRAAATRQRASLRLLLLRNPGADKHGIHAQFLANLRHLAHRLARQARELHSIAFGHLNGRCDSADSGQTAVTVAVGSVDAGALPKGIGDSPICPGSKSATSARSGLRDFASRPREAPSS